MNGLLLIGLISLLFGLLGGYLLRSLIAKSQLGSAEETAKRLLNEAKRAAEARKRESVLEIKEEMEKARAKFEQETKSRRIELHELERRLTQKEGNLDRKVDILEKKEREWQERQRRLSQQERWIAHQQSSLRKQEQGIKERLEGIAHLSSQEAKQLLMAELQDEARREASLTIQKIQQEASDEGEKKARRILSTIIQRIASEYTSEIATTTVALPNDEMKGRVIGREGRNIHAFENATGANIIVDDTPGAITLSCFEGVRREIARIALERLIADGRIQPARIEEVVGKAKKEMDAILQETGEGVVLRLGIGKLHPELVKLLGRLKHRTSLGQNVLQHSEEVSYIAGMLAAELGTDVKLAKRAGLLHDIGKAVDHYVEGSHPEIGENLARRYGESPRVINAVVAHHGDKEPESVEAVLVQAADAVSASRPGVRQESLEHYLKRLERLEKVASSFPGVEKVYAIQAGREVRIIVTPESISDPQTVQLSQDIAKKIEKELEYPGQIKVTVIRELRAVEMAK